MNCGQTLEVGLQSGTEGRIEGVARAPERVAAGLAGTSDQLERGGARRLELVRDVRVPEVDAGVGRRVDARGRGIVDDCFVNSGSVGAISGGLGVRGVRRWTSSKPGSLGMGVVACLWSGPQ